MKSTTHTRFIAIGVFAAGLMMSCHDPEVSPVKLVYEENFEGNDPFSTAYSKEVGNWEYALQYVTTPVFKGSRCARFEVRENEALVADGLRSEVVTIKGSEGNVSKNMWYSFAVYFPSEGYEYDHAYDVVTQWYQDGSPIRLLTKKDKLILEVGDSKDNKQELEIDDITKDTWNQFVFHIIHSHGSDGYIDVWYNGFRKATYAGGNLYGAELPKWKVGIVKPAFQFPGTSDVQNRIVYFDNILVGNDKVNYDEMRPGR